MSVFEYARRVEQEERVERGIRELLERPSTPATGPAVLEEIAQTLVELAIHTRDVARLWAGR